jgi:hypothetical protein
MSAKTSTRLTLLALAAAIAAPAMFAQPAAAQGDYADYRYRAFLATPTQAEKTKAAAIKERQTVRVGAEDSTGSQKAKGQHVRRFLFDVAPSEEQHYRN